MTDESSPRDNKQEPESAPKIIVDSDWKEQVEKEKAAAAEAAAAPEIEAATTPADETADASDETGTGGAADDVAVGEATEAGAAGQRAMPEPSFEVLVSMLFTQAISALGQMPNPIDGKTSVDKAMAKHSIDMLEMLDGKTKGNLSDDESQMLSEALHALRMAYVGVRG
ncbi:DUF1844 domain-containing protein [Allorhodopirellula solitaria]|uniref:DUF1844 domain-containing protein n=1 Tax=Allorhodopirellula solitaria TaxID=2527987 RepID=A0A5C5YGT3_9BACT|nr:DUF1844 domain-containing protein [Allorhodopirellula solitaria]TWT74259.1 hypothetical protein CA85_11460 [Allorhodopirellula solitaria]